MEDSEQRKKRLKEMREQADIAGVSGGVEGSGIPSLLSNPLIDAPSTTPSRDRSYAAPRFDFYTDPMNAFSSNKRNNASIQAAPDYFPPPNFGGSPMPQFSSPRPELTNPQMISSPTQASPAPYRNPVWNGPRGPVHYNLPFHPSSGGNYPSPRFDPSASPSYNYAQGVIHRPSHSPNPSPGYRNSPNPSPGRGRGFWHNNRSPVSGRGSGRRPSSYGHWSNDDRANGPDRFYKRSMVEDPWKLLKPILWKATDASLENSKFWSSKSMTTKREGSSAASVKSSSEPSLPSSYGHWSNDDRANGPDRFYKRSMVEDPWKLLKPILWKATDASLENSKFWSSKSMTTKREGWSAASVKSSSEPSLAEYLAAAFNEAAE